ncbi:hypothetical protein L596_004711 [Steinernema carpocapsae]|uniref:Uncharacterized protein n=1 Tax=Steinernema carpocapsae TaxID=34508 RepID=A0A4U8V0T7_STECR|nr:hypothetical protein L596_004711 [Steinernema carpocapsae]
MPRKESEKEQTREYSKRDKDKDRDASSSSSRREGEKEKDRTRASFSDRERLKKDMERDRTRRDTERDRSRASSDRKESRKEAASADRDRENRHRDKHRDAVEAETKSPKSKKDAKEGRTSHSSSSKSSSSTKDHHASEGSRRETSDTRQESSSSEQRRDKDSGRHSQKSLSDSLRMKRPPLPSASKHKSSHNVHASKSSATSDAPPSETSERQTISAVKVERTHSSEHEHENGLNSVHDEIPSTPKSSIGSQGKEQQKPVQLQMKLSPKVIRSMVPALSFSNNTEKINSLNYSIDGRHMVCSSHDDSITVYDCLTGKTHRSVNSKKYGVDLIRFDGSIHNAIHCSTKVDDQIRHLSLHDNRYIRYFLGHTKPVTMLQMLPYSTIFLSGSYDKTVRLWDLRTHTSQATTVVQSRPVGSFDQEGLIFGIGHLGKSIKLFDVRTFEKGPFAAFNIQRENTSEIVSLQFSPNGKTILLTTNGDECYLVDAFSGKLHHVLNDHINPLRRAF